MAIIGGVTYYSWQNPEYQQKFMFYPYVIKQRKEYVRFLTSGFIHADMKHLAFNLLVMFFFAEYVADGFLYYFGQTWVIHFMLLFLLGVIVSSIPTYFQYRELPHYRSLGASGGVSSILFAFILLHPTAEIGFLIPMPAFLYGTLYLIYSHYQGKKGNDNINHSAHIWGSVFGIVYPAILKPQVVIDFVDKMSHWSWGSLF